MSIQISVYEPPWKYLNIGLFKVFFETHKKISDSRNVTIEASIEVS